jgi:hypothetical protein
MGRVKGNLYRGKGTPARGREKLPIFDAWQKRKIIRLRGCFVYGKMNSLCAADLGPKNVISFYLSSVDDY